MLDGRSSPQKLPFLETERRWLKFLVGYFAMKQSFPEHITKYRFFSNCDLCSPKLYVGFHLNYCHMYVVINFSHNKNQQGKKQQRKPNNILFPLIEIHVKFEFSYLFRSFGVP